MPPKKKATTVPKIEGVQNETKQPQVSFQQKTPTNIVKPEQTKQQIVKQVVKKDVKKQQIKQGLLQKTPLTEAQILRLRREKFLNSTSNDNQQDPKVKQQRLKKFGLTVDPNQSKQQLLERKKKFNNPSSQILTEDQQVIKQRQMKFAANAAIITEPTEVLEERKKKFAKNQEVLLNLDDQIAKNKTKGIHKNRDRRFSNKQRKHGKLSHKSDAPRQRPQIKDKRKQVYDRKRFIKRSFNGKKPFQSGPKPQN